MPIKKAAFKALRQTKKHYAKNLHVKQTLKSTIKRTKLALAKETPEKITEILRQTTKTIDKAAKKHIIHKNKASRLKSRIAQQLKRLKQKTK